MNNCIESKTVLPWIGEILNSYARIAKVKTIDFDFNPKKSTSAYPKRLV